MRGKYWRITINNKEMIVKATSSSAAIGKSMVNMRKNRDGRDLNHGEEVEITIIRSSWKVMKQWQEMGNKIIL